MYAGRKQDSYLLISGFLSANNKLSLTVNLEEIQQENHDTVKDNRDKTHHVAVSVGGK